MPCHPAFSTGAPQAIQSKSFGQVLQKVTSRRTRPNKLQLFDYKRFLLISLSKRWSRARASRLRPVAICGALPIKYRSDICHQSIYIGPINLIVKINPMDVKTLCLGLLTINEACGYDLKKEFEAIFKHFYSAGYGSIYPALADLAENGLVSCREISQDGKPDRKTYSITETGRKAFDDALRNTNPQHKMRSEFLAMLYFADHMEADHLRTLMDDRVKELREAVLHIDRIEKEWGPDTTVGAQFVAGFGSAIAKAAADYIESNREMLFSNEVESPEHCNVTADEETKTVETRL